MINWTAWNRTVFDIETVLILNWIVWIRTVWFTEYLEVNVFDNYTVYLHLNCVLMLKWIVWNGTVFDIETLLRVKLNLFKNRTVLRFNCV